MIKKILKIMINTIIILIMAMVIGLFANFIANVAPILSIVLTLLGAIWLSYMYTQDS